MENKTEVSIFHQNFDSWPKFSYLTKISIWEQNFDCSPSFDFLPQFRFLTKISVFDQNFDFWPKCRCLTKISSLDQNFDFWPKLWFWRNIFRVELQGKNAPLAAEVMSVEKKLGEDLGEKNMWIIKARGLFFSFHNFFFKKYFFFEKIIFFILPRQLIMGDEMPLGRYLIN